MGQTLRAPDLGLGNSIALAINNAGQVVLLNHFEDGGDEAYLYSDGVYTPLGTLSGANGSASVAYDINELGQIIGTSSDVTSEHAFLYSEGEMFDLNELISPTLEWTLNNAVAINDSGQILVDAYGKDYGETKLLLTPVPEPSTLAVIAIGGLLLFARRRKTAKPVG